MDKNAIKKRFGEDIKCQLRCFYINCQGSTNFEAHLTIAAIKMIEIFDKVIKAEKLKAEGGD